MKKESVKKWLFLPVWLVLLMVVVSAAGLVAVFLNGWDEAPIAYFVYVFSFYTLTVLCIWLFMTLPGKYRKIKKRVRKNKYAGRYLTDAVFKTQVGLFVSLAGNVFYITINAVSAYVFKSYWFAIFAIYYGIMAITRLLLVRYVDRNEIGQSRIGELKRVRACAYILIWVNITLTGTILMMLYYDRGFTYRGFMIYVMAMYTFYATINAIVNLIKYRKYNSPVMSMSKVVKLTSTLFSMLFLETAMFSQFGDETPAEVKSRMILATGAGICIFVTGISVYMIVHSTREICELREKSING